jgi:hypothetical protein
MFTTRLIRSLIVTGMLMTTAIALPAAAIPGPMRDPFAHHRGLFVRLSAGLGYSNAKFHEDSGALTLSGLSGMIDFGIGGMIVPNFALAAEVFGFNAFEPTASADGQDFGELDNTSMRVGGFGVSGTYYIMPANIYASLAVGVGVGSLITRGTIGGVTFEAREDSDAGFALNFMLGKEWWIAPRWGLGLAAQVMFASLPPDADEGDNIRVFAVGLALSATFN